MPVTDFVTANVVLQPRAAPRPQFASVALLEILNSAQFKSFQTASSGARLLAIDGATWPDQLDALGITAGSVPYINVSQHFTGVRTPTKAYLSARGRYSPSLTHEVTITVHEDALRPGFTYAGDYRIGGGIEGGDYKHTTPDLFHTQTLTAVAAADFASGEFAVTFPDGFRAAVRSDQKDEWTLTVDNVAVGTYSFIVNTAGTADLISFVTTGGESINDIRAGLIASFNADPEAVAVGTISTSGAADIIVRAILPGIANHLDLTAITGPGGVGVDLSGVNTQDPQLDDTQVVDAIFASVDAYLTTLTSPTYGVVDASPVLTITALVKHVFQDMSVEHPTITPDTFALATTVQPRETVLETRDALTVLVTAGTHPTFTNGNIGSDQIVLNAVGTGAPIPVETTGPAGNEDALTDEETVSIVELRVAHKESIVINEDAATPGFAYDGTYIFTLLGEIVSVPIAASTAPIAAAGAMVTALNLAAGGKYSAANSGTDTITITDLTAGRPMLVTLAAPDALAFTQSVAQVSYGARDDIIAAADESNDWYCMENGAYNSADAGHRTDQEEGAKAIALLDPPRIGCFQTDEAASGSTAFEVGSVDVIARLKNASIERNFAVYHPSLDANSGIESYEGPLAKWTATVLTLPVGSVQWKGRALEGDLHGIRFAEGNTPNNLKDRDASWLERFDARQQNMMNGGYMLNGLIIDIVRALDTITSNVENAMLDLFVQQNIIPYSPDGIALGREAIQGELDRGITDGYVLPQSTVVVDPDLSTATAAERARGIMPPFTFTAVVQAGTYHMTVNGSITQ